MNRQAIVPTLLLLLVLALFGAQEWRFRRSHEVLRAELRALRAAATTPADPALDLPEAVRQLSQARSELATAQHRLTGALQQINGLQQQVRQLAARNPSVSIDPPGLRRLGFGPVVSSDPASGIPVGPDGLPLRRSWGEEQATGAPDTTRAGDVPTAWASRLPDNGEEWLHLEYSNAVQLAEVTVRETYNPGAISKLTAVLADGREQILWEGVTEPAEAPVDTVFPVPGNVTAQAVKVYLDTRRVPGWNEIDAVELVGRDGRRQWASRARASSSFADLR